MNQAFQYQRLVLGYHGCDKSVADRVLAGDDALKKSEKRYDWLGSGIYFWEHGPERALDWASEQAERGKIENPSVIGAVIHLGDCFDFMDIRSTRILAEAFPRYQDFQNRYGLSVPSNEKRHDGDQDLLRRTLDCSIINWLTEIFDADPDSPTYDSVRGVFQESAPAFTGSSIRLKSHIQLAIRNPACIVGYFRPF